uniref:Uncharacterized protein n=1 Tax=Tetradesmus obliquus TaxID=3088 RepID=A0A383V9F0_TETOB|eukprot:jgi/Sobl393_1/18180/SZX62198.1
MADRKDEVIKCLGTLCWLLRTSAAAATVGPDAMQQLLSMQHVPQACTAALVKAGVMPSWQQLLAAARSGYSVQQWLHACRKHDKVLPGAPALAEAALLADLDFTEPPSGSKLSQRLTDEQLGQAELMDVLYVGLSSGVWSMLSLLIDKRVPRPVEQWQAFVQWRLQQRALLAQLPPAAAVELMLVAITHGEWQFSSSTGQWTLSTLQELLAVDENAATDELYSSLLGDALTAAAKQLLSSSSKSQQHARRLLSGRTSAALSTDQVCELAIAAAKARADDTAEWLFGVLGAAGISAMTPDAVADLLVATAGRSGKITEQLCQLDAVHALSAKQVTGVLAAAVSEALKPAQYVGGAPVRQQHILGSLHVLTMTFSRTPVAEEALLGWLRSAVQCNSCSTVKALCRLKTARQLGAAQAAELLASALQLRHAKTTEVLIEMLYSALQPADIATDRLLELLRLAVQQGLAEVVKALCHTTAAVQLSVAPMVYEALCSLPALQQLQPQHAVELLLHAEQDGNTAVVSAISKCLPAAAQLAAAHNAG